MISRFALVLALALAPLASCSSPPQLGTTQHELLFATPSSWDFGVIPLGTPATPRSVTIGVSGLQDQYYTVNAITETCSDFSLDLSTIAFPADVYRFCDTCDPQCVPQAQAACESQSQYFAIHFTPTVAGPQSCTITIEYSGGTRQVTVMGTGDAPEHDITVLQPAGNALAFGDVVVGQSSAPLAIVVRSDGTMPLSITAAGFSGTGDPSQFAATGAGPITLQPGQTRQIDVRCAPSSPGVKSARFDIASNDPGQSLVTVALSCNGIQSNLAIDPSPARFPETLLGDTTTTEVNLFNSGSAPMVVESIQVTPSQFSVQQLADPNIGVMAGVPVPVEFTADASVVDQDVQGQLTVTYDGGETRTIDLIGPARSAVLSVTPGGQVDFGTVCAGQSERRLFAAINLGSGAFDLTAAELTGDGFALTLQPMLPAALPARGGATAAFEVSAMPPAGDVTGTLTLIPDVPNLAPATVALLAHGQLDGVGANPSAVPFDAIVVDQASGGRAVRLTNCEPSPLAITAASISGRDAADFTAVTDLALPGNIAAYGTATWLVELTPSSRGEKSASLDITHAAGTTSIPLNGIGIDATPDPARGSYYACSSSSPPTFALLLVPLFLLLPRRRRS